MCATATKSATEPTTKTKKSLSVRAAANRRNAQKSTGPKTDEGKAKSRFNALKHGMTAQSILLPGDDGQAFASRLRYLLEDLQPRNSLEGVVIERLAGDLWKSDRAEGSAGARISFRLRHEPIDQALKDRHAAIELGQHLLWQPAWPLPVGLNEGEAKGAMAKFPLADAPGDPHHPARLLLKLEATVAGCDWLLRRWDELRLRLEGPGLWSMEHVWKMVRLLGKTALEVKDDFQVTLLVLASLALEPEPEPESGSKATFAEALRAITRDDRLARVVAGITRLCEPFQQALARMPLDKLAPANEDEARQRLFTVVEQEEGRIGRIRAMLQKIADADLAEAPVRLAFESGTEGDRGRRYVLSYERLVNRRIDTFLKVRKASGSGELDLIELEKALGSDQFAELTAAAGIKISQATGDLRSGDGRAQETLAQRSDPDAHAESPSVSPFSETCCDDDTILRNEANAESASAPSLPNQATTAPARTEHDATTAIIAVEAANDGPDAENEVHGLEARATHEVHGLEARAAHAAETAGAAPTAENASPVADAAVARGDDCDLVDSCDDSRHLAGASKDVVPSESFGQASAQGPCEKATCDGRTILRYEATATGVTDPGYKRTCDGRTILRNEATAAPDDPRNSENEGPPAPAVTVETGPQAVIESAKAGERSPLGDEPIVAPAAAPPVSAARLAELLVPMDRAALALLTRAELEARRWAMYSAQRKSAKGHQSKTDQGPRTEDHLPRMTDNGLMTNDQLR